MSDRSLVEGVARLRTALENARFPLEVEGAAEARATQAELVGQMSDYVLPRLQAMEAPLLAVIGGSTGAGKSALVNSIIGRVVSASGVLRPTTTTPVLAANPRDISWFEDDRVLPDLARTTGGKGGPDSLILVADADVPEGIALLDAPDIDSVVRANRELAAQLLAAGDLWLFVTTASRYSDAVPWDFLRKARSRSTALALVLNRVPAEALEEVPGHLAQMLEREGLDAPVLTVPETSLVDGLIPAQSLSAVSDWLKLLAADADARADMVRQTLQGTLVSLQEQTREVLAALDDQAAAANTLAEQARAAHDDALREIEAGLSSGALLRGEVLARWHEFVGTGDFMKTLQTGIGRFRDRMNEMFTGQPPVAREVQNEVERNIEAVVIAALDKARERTISSWRSTSFGRERVTSDGAPEKSSDLPRDIETEVRHWQSGVLELVRAQGASKRAAGRFVSLGVNGVGAALMIAVFAQTGGLTGGEVVIAGGTAALSQRLLEALFGDEAVRDLTSKARADLLQRMEKLIQAEADRFERVALSGIIGPADVADVKGALESLGTGLR